MSHEHDEAHEMLLAEVLAGERPRGAPDVERRLASCDVCRARMEELESVVDTLADTAADRAADLAAARVGAQPGAERFAARLRELAGSASTTRHRRSPWPGLLAAALVVALGIYWRARAPEPEPAPPPILLGPRVELDAPRGESSFARFSWRYSGRAAGGYLVRVYDAGRAENAPPILEIACKDSTWTPSPAQLESLPQRLRWEVDALGDFGRQDVVASSEPALAWR